MHAVAEAARNVACTGARPVAATNCLNFGNPEKPEVMWQFSEVMDGIAEACRALEIPITGGNVSFYNETLGKPIYPTPILGVLGVLEDADFAVGSAFDKEGDVIVLLDGAGEAGAARSPARDSSVEFSSSEYAKTMQGIVAGAPPAIDLAAEKRLIDCLVNLASAGLILSAHDVSDGGIAVTIAESCFASDGLSADVNLSAGAASEAGIEVKPSPRKLLFSANAGRAPLCRFRPLRLPDSTRLRHNTEWPPYASEASHAANFASNMRARLL